MDGFRVALVLLAAAACGDNIIPGPHVDENGRSGTRLEVHWNDVQDTWVPDTTHFHDLDLDIECTPRQWEDGVWRCTIEGLEGVYTDAGCTQLVGRYAAQPTDTRVPTYILTPAQPGAVFTGSAVGGVVRRTDEPITGVTLTYFRALEDGQCYRYPLTNEYTYYGLGESVPASRFATMYREENNGESALVPIDFSSDDDMHVRAGVRFQNGFDCQLQARDDGAVVYCMPPALIEPAYYADDSCTQFPIGHRPGVYALRSDFGGCPTFAVAFLDQSIAFGNVNRRTATGCERVNVEPQTALYQLFNTTTAPTSTRVTAGGPEQRFQNIIIGTTRGPVIADTVFDATYQTDCIPDGTTRTCTPVGGAEVVTLYANAECGDDSRVTLALVNLGCDTDQRFAGGRNGEPAYRVDAIARSRQYFIKAPRCAPYNPPSGTEMHDVSPLAD